MSNFVEYNTIVIVAMESCRMFAVSSWWEKFFSLHREDGYVKWSVRDKQRSSLSGLLCEGPVNILLILTLIGNFEDMLDFGQR